MMAGTTVVVITAGVDAGSIAVGQFGGTDTLAVRAGRTARAGFAAGTAVAGVTIRIHAGSIAVGLTRCTNTLAVRAGLTR